MTVVAGLDDLGGLFSMLCTLTNPAAVSSMNNPAPPKFVSLLEGSDTNESLLLVPSFLLPRGGVLRSAPVCVSSSLFPV